MATFLTSPDICQTSEVNFFTSAAYTRPSFSRSWGTLTTPDVEGLTTPVYLLVLDKFNIPVDLSNGQPPGGFLPGMDIKRMNAIDAIRLSMAEALTQGQWWEMYEDVQGGVYFQNVFNDGSPGKTIQLDVRLCIPSSNKTNEVDMVIVRGYDAPPEVYARGFNEFPDVIPPGPGIVNPNTLSNDRKVFTVDMAEMIGGCHATVLRRRAVKSFSNPLIDDTYGTQTQNPFYDVKAHEEVLHWAVKIDGMPEAPEDAAKVKYEFSDTTTWYFQPTFPTFVRRTELNDEDFGCTTSLQGGGEITYYSASFTYEGPLFTDRYGLQWPFVIRPSKVFYAGYKINALRTFGATGDSSSTTFVFVDPVKELLDASAGSQWNYTIPGVNQFEITLFNQPKIDPIVWDVVLESIQLSGDVALRVWNGNDVLNIAGANALTISEPGLGIMPGVGDLGYLVTGFFLGLEVDRPCVVVTTAEGDAREYSDALRVQYAPIIKKDPPPPIAYKHKDFGVVELGEEEQAESLTDNDPTTCQNFEQTPMAVMQDRMQGNVVDVTLPFCEDTAACARVASTIFDYQAYENIQTITLTCGPDDEPELGAAVDGFDSNLRVSEISYSYNDGSAYTIQVTLSPVFANVGSWNNGNWTRQTQDSGSREAFIIWSAGDGLNYRVMVQGLGVFNAINVAKGLQSEIWRVGERVTVNVRNIPIEDL